MAFYTKWQFVPPLFLHVCMDHIVQHSTIVLSDLPGINYSIHNWLGCLCGKKIADFQPGDFWNCMFADLALGSK